MGNDGLSSKQVGSQASCRVNLAAGLDPTYLHKHECGSSNERAKNLYTTFSMEQFYCVIIQNITSFGAITFYILHSVLCLLEIGLIMIGFKVSLSAVDIIISTAISCVVDSQLLIQYYAYMYMASVTRKGTFRHYKQCRPLSAPSQYSKQLCVIQLLTQQEIYVLLI